MLRKNLRTHHLGLEILVTAEANLGFDSMDRKTLRGKYTRLQAIYARVLAKYLKAALVATCNYSKNPEGQLQFLTTAKLMTGNDNLNTLKAYDLIKKILSISPKDIEDLIADTILKEAEKTAKEKRPNPKRKEKIPLPSSLIDV